MRKLIFSPSLGVIIGSVLGMAFWSKIDPLGMEHAETFASDDDVQNVLATWDKEGLPADVQTLNVTADIGGVFASIAACVSAGAPRWSPTSVFTPVESGLPV